MMGYLMRNRVIFIGSRINDEVCTGFTPKVKALQATFQHVIIVSVMVGYSFTILMGMTLQVATNIVASLLAMEAMNDAEDIKLYINSPGELLPEAPMSIKHAKRLIMQTVRNLSIRGKVIIKLHLCCRRPVLLGDCTA